jgi:ATP-dependent Clp protease, protease subunit
MFVKKTIDALLNKETDLKSDPVIIRINKFDEKSAAEFIKQMGEAHNTGQTIIPIIIDSYGGYVYALMSMISAIKHATLPVATIVQGKAMSCGAILTTFGEDGKRFSDPDATMMIHDVSSFAGGKNEELKMSAKQTDKLNTQVYHMMAQNCGKPDDYFLKIADKKKHADWYLDAKEAKKHNIVQHLRVPSFTVKVKVEMEFE